MSIPRITSHPFDREQPWMLPVVSTVYCALLFFASVDVVSADDTAQARAETEAQIDLPIEIQPVNIDLANIETITIIGKRRQLPGAAMTLESDDLRRFSDTNIHKLLSIVPGVHFRSEEGYGLRPNIGIRGTPNERSGKITIMEDGVLIAPAPYSAPSAYYFPSTARIASIEVVKGPTALTEGPYTIGGALNLISTPIPSGPGPHGSIRQTFGSDDLFRTQAMAAFNHKSGISGMVETTLQHANGFDSIDRVADDTGFSISDHLGKLRFFREQNGIKHRLDLKYLFTKQRSNQTYVGLAEDDFKRDAHKRYGLTAYDYFDSARRAFSALYSLKTSTFKLRVLAFNNDYQRTWFRIRDVDFSTGATVDNYNPISVTRLITLANDGNLDAIGALRGTRNALIRLRDTAREYKSEGLAVNGAWMLSQYELRFGYRRLKDEESRLQPTLFSRQIEGQLGPLFNTIAPNGSNNRITKGEGESAFVQSVAIFNTWSANFGIRHEVYELNERRYTDAAARNQLANGFPQQRADDSHTLFGGGVIWTPYESLDVFLGFHQGLSPSRNSAKSETADNWEAGIRYDKNLVSIEGTVFNSAYANIVGECRLSSQGAAIIACEPGTAFDGGAATIRGVELYMKYVAKISPATAISLSLSYGYTDATFDTTFNNADFWGDVQSGDRIPYLPKHQLALRVGWQIRSWNLDLQRLSYSNTCALAECTVADKINGWHNYDLRISKTLADKNLSFYGTIQNLTDQEDIVTRSPNSGIRAQQPRTFLIGVSYAL